MKKIAIVACAALLVSCAKKPEDVAGTNISPALFAKQSCSSLRQSEANLKVNVANLSAKQSNARTTDTVGVLLVGLPLSSMTGGDVEADLANYKGQLQAVQQAEAMNGC